MRTAGGIFLISSAISCTAPQNNKEALADTRPTLTVSVEPLRNIAEQVAGNAWRVTTLVPKGGNPETYEPTAAQLTALSQSKAYFLVGNLGFETAWSYKLQHIAPNVTFIRLSPDGQHSDPHIWTSPSTLKLVAQRICNTLCQIDSTQTNTYKANLKTAVEQLNTLDTKLHTLLDTLPHKAFLIYHPSLTHFAHDYGLKQIAVENNGKEPTPRQLANLVEQCKALNIQTIFIQKEFNTHNAQLIATETKAHLEVINPLAYDYEQQLLHIAQILHNQ